MASLFFYCISFFLLVAIFGWPIKDCNLNRRQCLQLYRSDRNSSKYKSDCYELENGFYEREVFACVDTCNPETAKSHHMLRCDYNCEGKWNTSMWCFSFCHFERCWYFLLLVTEIKLGKFRKGFVLSSHISSVLSWKEYSMCSGATILWEGSLSSFAVEYESATKFLL